MAAERPRVAIPWESPTLRVVLASTLVLPLGVPLVSPALPVVRDALRLTDPQASLLVTAYFMPGVLTSPLVGVLVDRAGRRPVLPASLLVFATSGALVALGPPFSAILVLRAIQGTAATGVFVTTATLLGDAFEGAERNTVMGTTIATLSVGRTVYPVCGGLLATLAWNAPFVASLLALPAGLFAHRSLPASPPSRTVERSASLGMVVGLVPPRETLVLFGATLALEVVTFGAIITVLPFRLVDRFGLSPGAVGTVLAVVMLAASATAARNGRLAVLASNPQLVAGSFVCFGVGLAGTALANGIVGVAVAAAVFGAGLGVAMPSVDAELAGLVAAQHRGGAFSLRNGLTFLGRAAGPVTFTVAAGATDYQTTLLVASAVTLAAGLGCVVLATR